MKYLLIILFLFTAFIAKAQVRGSFSTGPNFVIEQIVFKKNGTYKFRLGSCTYEKNITGQYSKNGDTIILNSYINIPDTTVFTLNEDMTEEEFQEIKYLLLCKKYIKFIDTTHTFEIMEKVRMKELR